MSRSRKAIAMSLLSILLFQLQWTFGQNSRPNPDKFRHERVILPGGQGPNRLLINAELLAGSSSLWQLTRQIAGSEQESITIATGGLSDLRIYDSLNRETPYLLIMPPMPEPKWLDGKLAPLAPGKKSSGFQLDLGRSYLMDRLQLSGIPAPYVKRCILEASDNARQWTMLRSDATIFDLPSEKLRLIEIEFDRGEYRYLKVTWDDSASARIALPGSVSARLVSAGSLPPRLKVSIPFERRVSEPGVSRYRLRLPAPRLPITEIQLSAGDGNVLRQARIAEARLTGSEIIPKVLGAATLRREVRGEVAAAEMSIPIASPQETRLELTIEDGNNPPLEITEISAFFAYLPWIYFESADEKPLIARYGYADLEEPRYDLEAARASASKIPTTEARWGAESEVKPEQEHSADNGLASAGSPIDLGGFRYVRSIIAGKSGLSSLPLDAAVLAHCRLDDVRIAGSNGHQIPYLLEKVDEPLFLDLPAIKKVQAPKSKSFSGRHRTGTWSYYQLRLPYSGLPDAHLVLTTSASVFRRTLSLFVERNPFNERQESWTESIAGAVWSHADPEIAAPALTLKIPSLKTTEAMLVVEEGDNSPLPITSARLILPAYRLRFFHKAEVKLYYGQSDLDVPRYDLAILAPRLMGAAAEEIQLGPEIEVSPLKTRSLSTWLFWGILVGAVFILLILIARLAKKA
jgi:hypothetical protein